jgi:serine/threonine-protein kinase RsbT
LAIQTLDRVRLVDQSDVAAARRRIRELALRHALPPPEIEALATAVSEVVRNVIVHAGHGELELGLAHGDERPAIVVVVRDDGPGIENQELAMRDGYSSKTGLGLGLPSAQRLVDAFELVSAPGRGTVVTLRKWIPAAAAR